MAAPALHVAILAAMLLVPFLSVPAEAQTKKFCLTQFAIASQACAILPPTSPEHRDDDDEDEDEDEDNDEDEDEDSDEDNDDSGGGGGERRRRRDRDQHDKKSGVVVSKPASSVAGKPSLSSSMITVEAADEVDADDDAQRNGTAATPAVGNHTSGGGSGGGGGSGSGHRRRRRRRGSRRHRRRHRRGRLRDGEDGGEDGDEDEDEDEDNDEDNDDDEDEDEDEDDDDDDDDDDGHRAYRDCCRWLKEVEPDCVCQALLRLPSFLVKPQHKYTVKVGHSCKFTYRCGGT